MILSVFKQQPKQQHTVPFMLHDKSYVHAIKKL